MTLKSQLHKNLLFTKNSYSKNQTTKISLISPVVKNLNQMLTVHSLRILLYTIKEIAVLICKLFLLTGRRKFFIASFFLISFVVSVTTDVVKERWGGKQKSVYTEKYCEVSTVENRKQSLTFWNTFLRRKLPSRLVQPMVKFFLTLDINLKVEEQFKDSWLHPLKATRQYHLLHWKAISGRFFSWRSWTWSM